MNIKTKLWPYVVSNSASAISTTINTRNGISCIRLKSSNSRYVFKNRDIVINWGNGRLSNLPSREPSINTETIINNPATVNVYGDKRLAFSRMNSLLDTESRLSNRDYRVAEYTERRDVAQQWLDAGIHVVCRHTTRGHSGEGIEIIFANSGSEVPEAPLYTQYVNKSKEYRMHFVRYRNRFFTLLQQKRRDFNTSDPDWRIRNYENGFIYSVNDVQELHHSAEVFCDTLSKRLDFGAIDFMVANNSIYNREILGIRSNTLVALEINTAPGVQSDTVKAFYREHLGNKIKLLAGEMV